MLKCHTFYIKVCFVQIDRFKMRNYRPQHSIIHFDRVSKDFRVFLFLLIVQSIDSFSQFRSRLVRLYLKLVRLTFFRGFCSSLIFTKINLHSSPKAVGGERRPPPHSVWWHLIAKNEIFSVYRLNIIFASLIESKFLGLSICMRQISQDVLLTLQCAEFIGNI